MSLLRYNWLRKCGYCTVSGQNWRDPEFGNTWVELIMKKGLRLKKVKINGAMKWREYKWLEEKENE